MTITAFLEAAKKATEGPWHEGHMCDSSHPCDCRFVLSEVAYFGSICEVSKNNGRRIGEGGNDCPPEDEAIWNARFIASARNAAKEIDELVNLCRKITDRGRTVSAEDVDRIREIVGGGE